MFIGEAPGMNEDKQGRPFVGAAGKFLDELLAAAGFTRDDVYICNVLKCRPPSNRDPLPTEIEACRGYLERQIELVDPALIVSLGRYSMNHFFPQAKISRVHGQSREIGGRMFMPMYHPAAALHQQNLRQVILDDFAGIPAVLENARNLRRTHHVPPPEPATGAAEHRSLAHSPTTTEQIPLFE
jgi:uracil-DNA glycosylase